MSAKEHESFTPGAQQLVEAAIKKQQQAKHNLLGVHHWLLALVERHGPMAEAMAQGLEASSLQQYLYEQLQQGNAGVPLVQEDVVSQAMQRAKARGRSQAAERDLAAVILAAAGYTLVEESTSVPSPTRIQAPTPTPSDTRTYRPRSTRPTPTLERFGRDLTREALEGKLRPVVGRDEEIQVLIETLCRQTKRNPCLVGPAGVGKTAIVEGFAQMVVRGEVPEVLKGVRVLAVQPSTLVAGAGVEGELEKRMNALLSEASQDGIVLFIDEVHSMIGAGGRMGTSDVASLLKPALARGDLACIAATTDDEYRRFIEPDSALERRFQPIRVQELTPEQTLQVLFALRHELFQQRGVHVPDEVLTWLIDCSQRFLRNRYFPDKAVDLLEQCVAHAVIQDKKTVEQADAELVAYRMVGLPMDLPTRLGLLKEHLARHALLTENDTAALLSRLEVSVRGLDLRPARPNAVVLLTGNAVANSERLAETIAFALLGAAERVVTIDLSRFVHPADVTMLLGAPPGYVGYSEALTIHRIAQMPWCVIRFENIHACHPVIREILQQALADGFLTDGCGKRIYLSDTIVLLTADLGLQSERPVGFREWSESSSLRVRQSAEKMLGAELVAQVDLMCAEVPSSEIALRRWLEEHLLAELSERYRKQGLHLRWDENIIQWLISQQRNCANQRDWERLVDSQISPLLVEHLPAAGQKDVSLRIIKDDGNLIRVEKEDAGEGEKQRQQGGGA